MKKLKTDQSSSLGIPHGIPLHFKNHQASKLGDAQGILSSSSTIIRLSPLKLRFYHFTYYVLLLEHYFILLSDCSGYFVSHILCWILAILCGRETCSDFLLEYS